MVEITEKEILEVFKTKNRLVKVDMKRASFRLILSFVGVVALYFVADLIIINENLTGRELLSAQIIYYSVGTLTIMLSIAGIYFVFYFLDKLMNLSLRLIKNPEQRVKEYIMAEAMKHVIKGNLTSDEMNDFLDRKLRPDEYEADQEQLRKEAN